MIADPSSALSFKELLYNIASLPPKDRRLAMIYLESHYGDRLEYVRHADYVDLPVEWVENVLGEFVWSKQREILESIRDHRRTAVRSCHGPGKSHIASRAIAWWTCCHSPGSAMSITSAPTGDQVRAILWQGIADAHMRGELHGRLNQTEWWMNVGKDANGKDVERLVALGRKPDDYNPAAFAGFHPEFLFLTFDEAGGMSTPLYEIGDSLLSNEAARFLAIGNPNADPDSEFYRICQPGSGWNVITISVFDTPNFTGEYVPADVAARLVSVLWEKEKRAKWGTDHPIYIAQVLGQFPENATTGLITPLWVRQARENVIIPSDDEPVELGVDVGGGGNPTVVVERKGRRARVISEDTNPSTMETTYNIIRLIRSTGAIVARVDRIGIGKGVIDRAYEMSIDEELAVTNPAVHQAAGKIVGINVGLPPVDDPDFKNLKAQALFHLRHLFETGFDIESTDNQLAKELLSLKTKYVSGKIQSAEKPSGQNSPNRAEALMLACLDFADPEEYNVDVE